MVEGYNPIRCYTVIDASVHGSQKLDYLLDSESPKRPVYADSAYRSEEQEARLKAQALQSEIHQQAYRNKPLTEAQKADNRRKSKTRVRVEHVFAAQAQLGGHFIRCIGLARAKLYIGLTNLVYNLKRLEQIVRLQLKPYGVSAPATPYMGITTGEMPGKRDEYGLG